MIESIASFGPVRQLAYMPRDMEAALAFWTKTMGVGPFFSIPHITYKASYYHGEPSNFDISVLLGYWGDVQIELTEQHNDAPSVYRRWVDEGREGLHHVCLWADDLANARKVCTAAGARIEQEVQMEGAGAIYVDVGGGPGTMMEILQPSPEILDVFTMMRDASRGWDGRDPVRPLG